MIGPVVALEWLIGSRRGKLTMLRRVYAGWLVAQLMLLLPGGFETQPTHQVLGRFINSYLEKLVGQHFVLLVLATPTFVAGAIAEEKSRHTLDYLLTAYLSSWEIVIGKLLGRLAQVGTVALVVLPLLGAVGGYAALPPLSILALAIVTVVPFFGLGALSLLASVWSRQTRDAVLRVYVWLILAAFLIWGFHEYVRMRLLPGTPPGVALGRLVTIDDLLRCLSPLYVIEAAWDIQLSGVLAWRLLVSSLLWGTIGLVCVCLSIWRLRPVYQKQLAAAPTKSSWAVNHYRCDDAPIAWKEREVDGLAILPGLRRIPRWCGLLAVFGLAAALAFHYLDDPYSSAPMSLAALGIFLSGLVVGIRASGAVVGERERQTWDPLLLSPLDNRELVRQKFRGVMQSVTPYFLVYAFPLLVLAVAHGAQDFTRMLMVLVSTWIMMYFMAATGIFWSICSTSSWRSLLATLAAGYGYAIGIYFASTTVFLLSFCFVFPLLAVMELDVLMPIVFCVVECWFFWYVAQWQIASGIRWLTRHERTRTYADTQGAADEYLERWRSSI